jgi:hypothetical protein
MSQRCSRPESPAVVAISAMVVSLFASCVDGGSSAHGVAASPLTYDCTGSGPCALPGLAPGESFDDTCTPGGALPRLAPGFYAEKLHE